MGESYIVAAGGLLEHLVGSPGNIRSFWHD